MFVSETMVTADMFLNSITRDRKLPNALQAKILSSIKKQLNLWTVKMDISPEVLERDESLGLLILDLDMHWKGFHLKDEILWDPYNPHSSPETFAISFCKDLGLHSEWCLVIAHHLRSRLFFHFRSLYQFGQSQLKRVPRKPSVEFQSFEKLKQQSQFLYHAS
jgi:hypothetical protein